MIKYIKGNLLKGGDDVIAHGCNCILNMGAGVALEVKNTYPKAFEADKATKFADESKLGTYTQWTGQNVYFPEKLITIVNAYTQFSIFGRDFRFPQYNKYDLFEYEHFKNIIEQMKDEFEGKTIAFPKIGAGLAHGDWNRIEKIINDGFGEKEVKVYIL